MTLSTILRWSAALTLLAACSGQDATPPAPTVEARAAPDAHPPAVDAAAEGHPLGGSDEVVVLAPADGEADPLSPQMLEAAAAAAERAAEGEAGDGAELASDEPPTAAEPPEPERPAPDPNADRPVGRLVRLPADPVEAHRVLPALSEDGARVATLRYDSHGDGLWVEARRVRDGRVVRRWALDGDESSRRRVGRALAERGFRTLRAIPSEPPRRPDGWSSPSIWRDASLRVRYDAATGGLAAYDADGFLVSQTLVPARSLDHVDGMQDRWARARYVPELWDVYASANGDVLVLQLGLCTCSCDIEPYWRVLRIGAPFAAEDTPR